MKTTFLSILLCCTATYSQAANSNWYFKTQLKINFDGYKALQTNSNNDGSIANAAITELATSINNNNQQVGVMSENLSQRKLLLNNQLVKLSSIDNAIGNKKQLIKINFQDTLDQRDNFIKTIEALQQVVDSKSLPDNEIEAVEVDLKSIKALIKDISDSKVIDNANADKILNNHKINYMGALKEPNENLIIVSNGLEFIQLFEMAQALEVDKAEIEAQINALKTQAAPLESEISQLEAEIKIIQTQQVEMLKFAKAAEVKQEQIISNAKLANEQYVVDSNKKINNYYLYDTYARLVSLGYNLNNNFAVELSLASANLVTSFNLTPKSSLYLHAGVSVYNLAEYGVGFKYNNISLGLMVQHPRNIVNNKFVYEGITFVNNFDTGLKVSTTLSYSF